MSFIFITDPWDTLDHSNDTTLRLAEEAFLLGYQVYWADVKTIRWEIDQTLLEAFRIENVLEGRKADSFKFVAGQALSISDFKSAHYRVDPPVDLEYLHPLQLLTLGACVNRKEQSVQIVNPPSAIFSASEKLEGGLIKDAMPPSIATCQWNVFYDFGKTYYQTVLKPLHCAQSFGIELLDWRTDTEVGRSYDLLESATNGFRQPVLLQKYLECVQEGEIRLWFIVDELIGWVKKIPKSGDFRVNIDKGAEIVGTQLSVQERNLASSIGKALRAKDIRLAAVDLIGGFITDYNITSPGLIVQIEKLMGENLSRQIIQKLLPVR